MQIGSRRGKSVWAAALAVASAAAWASDARAVIVKNASFQSPATGGFSDNFGNPAINNPSNAGFWGWGYFFDTNTAGDKATGVQQNANSQLTGNSSDGSSQNCWVNGEGSYIFQDVGTLLANKQYSLTVAATSPGGTAYGGIGSGNNQPTMQLMLVNGNNVLTGTTNGSAMLAYTGTVLGTFDIPTPGYGTWADYTLNYTSPASVSGNLTIVLKQTAAGLHEQGIFDNVRLTYIGETAPVPTWTVDSSGDWNVAANWTTNTIPNAAGAEADFLSAISAPHTVYTDTAVTASILRFSNANGYVVSGAGSLTLQGSGTITNLIDVQNGTHKISLPMTIASSATFNAATGSTLKISNPMTINAGQTVTQTGAGTVMYESTVDVLTGAGIAMGSPSHMAALRLSASATATLTSGMSAALKSDAVSLNATSTLDLNNNDLVTSTGKSTIENLVKNARNGGTWNQPGITSTTAKNNANHTTGIGVLSGAEYSSVGGTGTFSGKSYAATDTLVKYTWNGDANFDGRVTFDDYVKIDTGFNTHLTGWLNGDFNYSGAVNFDDYVLIDIAFNQQNGTLGRAIDWISGDDRSESGRTTTGVAEVIDHLDQFGGAYGAAFLAAVPEPTGLVATAGALAGLMVARRRNRR